jgi:hypothetical protein
VLGVLAAPGQAQPWDVPGGPNLVTNAGFEDTRDPAHAAWSRPAEVYGIDHGVARTGRRALRYVNNAPARYLS